MDVGQLVKEMRECLPGEIARTLIDALEEKAGAREGTPLQAVAKLARLTRRHMAISAGMGAVVGCLILVPLIIAAARPPPVVIVPPGGPDTSPRWLEPEVLLAWSEWGEKRPLDQTVPFRTLPGQMAAPCPSAPDVDTINGNCWVRVDVRPPCGALFRHGDKCYRPISAKPWPAEPGPDRLSAP